MQAAYVTLNVLLGNLKNQVQLISEMFYLLHYIKNIISTYDQWNIVHFLKLGIQNPVSIILTVHFSSDFQHFKS